MHEEGAREREFLGSHISDPFSVFIVRRYVRGSVLFGGVGWRFPLLEGAFDNMSEASFSD